VKRLKKPVQELGEKILFRRISLVKSVICIELCSIMTLIQHPLLLTFGQKFGQRSK
jgi:hypothetical protein